ncbi:MAG: hypothetical protein ACRDPY_42935 [Streptosporangiaceae bacterium]
MYEPTTPSSPSPRATHISCGSPFQLFSSNHPSNIRREVGGPSGSSTACAARRIS